MRLFLIGHPVAHSISPQLHNAALAALGLPPCYELLDTPPEQLAATIERLRDATVLGANVTVPHKQSVIPYLDELAASAARVGAVNTIAREAGRLCGHNTDGAGILAALAEEEVEVRGRQVVLLGAGGAARAIAHAMVEAGAASLAILNRDPQKARDLAAALGSTATAVAAARLERDALTRYMAEADLLINATTVGLHGEPALVPEELIPAGIVVCDIIYNPPETALLRAARAAGARTLNGLGMLVHQAAAALSIWLQQPVPVEVMHRAALEALTQRRGQP